MKTTEKNRAAETAGWLLIGAVALLLIFRVTKSTVVARAPSVPPPNLEFDPFAFLGMLNPGVGTVSVSSREGGGFPHVGGIAETECGVPADLRARMYSFEYFNDRCQLCTLLSNGSIVCTDALAALRARR